MAFNRDRNFQGGGFKRDFNDRGSRGPVEMHQAVCAKCGKNCEVPFRPTSGKPVYCSDCFDRNRDSQPARSNDEWRPARSNFEDRQMNDAVCDECGKNCKVPFRPTEGKPIYCSTCFGNKKNSEGNGNNQSDYKEQFEALNRKLDKILKILETAVSEEVVTEEVAVEKPEKPVVKAVKKPRAAKKAA